MSTIPIRRKRLLGLPVWVLPALIAIVLLTGWMALSGDDEPEVDVVEAGPDHPPGYVAEPTDLGLPPDPPRGASVPGTSFPSASAPPEADAAPAADDAVIAAAAAAGAAAGARASQAVLASAADVGRTIRGASPTAGALNGRAVQLSGVRVSEVLSDRAFMVGTGSDRVMIIMDPSGGDAPVAVGDRVSVVGSLESFAPGASASGVAPDAGQRGYVVATRPGGITR